MSEWEYLVFPVTEHGRYRYEWPCRRSDLMNKSLSDMGADRWELVSVSSGKRGLIAWLKTEFVDLHNYARDANPLEAYKQIAKIVAKMVTRKAEIKAIEEIREIKLVWHVTDTKNQLPTT